MDGYKHINAVGFEYEGVFHVNRMDPGDLHSDGSLFDLYCPDCGADLSNDQCWQCEDGYICGEYSSRVYRRRGSLLAALRDAHPVIANASCGTHVHVSFNTLIDYSAVVRQQKEVQSTLLYVWKQTCSDTYYRLIERRCRGDYAYLSPSNCWGQLIGDVSSRYFFLNASAWHNLGTLELRVLPGMAREYVEDTINAVESALSVLDRAAAVGMPPIIGGGTADYKFPRR